LFCLPFRVPLSCPLSFGRLFFLSRPKASWEGGIVTVMVLLVLNDRNIWTRWYINMVHGSELSLDSSLLLSSRFVLSRLISFRPYESFDSLCLIRLVLSHSSRFVSFVSLHVMSCLIRLVLILSFDESSVTVHFALVSRTCVH
jgi:hypothetical protein